MSDIPSTVSLPEASVFFAQASAVKLKLPERKPTSDVQQELWQHVVGWADSMFHSHVTGFDNPQDFQHRMEATNRIMSRLQLKGINADEATKRVIDAFDEMTGRKQLLARTQEEIQTLPDSAHEFNLYYAQDGRSREIPSFNIGLSHKIATSINNELAQFVNDRDTSHIQTIKQLTEFAHDARKLYQGFSARQLPVVEELRRRLNYLGLTKNLIAEGENAQLIVSLVKSSNFGRLTPEDRGRSEQTSPKNKITTGKSSDVHPLNTTMTDSRGQRLPTMHDSETTNLISALTSDPDIASLKMHYANNPTALELIDWTAAQAIQRQLLPRETVVPVREIDMSKLQKIKGLGAKDSSDGNFQSSNPLSLWQDPETGRKFLVKHCPEQTLQSDYFGLEVLQLTGVPIYEFYNGSLPGNHPGDPTSHVLVTGFLEGFENPSLSVELKSGDPEVMKKFRFPERLKTNRFVQQAMLGEILIGEYNSRAHNFMILGKSVQHLDQGACLTSTASGKFKGFSEEISMQDIRDVLHSYPDWDYNAIEPVNEAYAQVAEIVDDKLVIHDVSTAKRLLTQLRSVPQEKIDEALEHAGFQDGPGSIARMESWIKHIDDILLPDFQLRAKANPSARMDQYIRWANSAKETFIKAIHMGGELSYYKQALRTRRASLDKIWEQAIKEASV